MNENVFKKTSKGTQKKKKVSGNLHGLLDGSILSANKVVALLPFFFFLTLLAILLIFNTYYAEKKAREIEVIRKEVVELHLNYISVKSSLMYLSNQSEVSKRLKDEGFVESVVPPVIIKDSEKENNFFKKVFTNNRK